jgi:DNA-binding MarR family transcriptional regulator
MSSSRNADMEPPRSLRSLPPEGAAGGFGRPGAAGLDSSAVEHLLGYLLAVAEVPTRRTFQHHIGGPFDLRPVEFTLLVLLHANGRASAKQVCRALRLPAPHVTTLVDRLAARGLVDRGPDPHDGRAVRIVLTEGGHALADKLRAVAATMEDSLQAALTAGEQVQLRRLLLKLARAGQE